MDQVAQFRELYGDMGDDLPKRALELAHVICLRHYDFEVLLAGAILGLRPGANMLVSMCVENKKDDSSH